MEKRFSIPPGEYDLTCMYAKLDTCDAARFPKDYSRGQRHGECKLAIVHNLSRFS